MFLVFPLNRFGKYSHDELSILVPLNQCCRYVSPLGSFGLFPLTALKCWIFYCILWRAGAVTILPRAPEPGWRWGFVESGACMAPSCCERSFIKRRYTFHGSGTTCSLFSCFTMAFHGAHEQCFQEDGWYWVWVLPYPAQEHQDCQWSCAPNLFPRRAPKGDNASCSLGLWQRLVRSISDHIIRCLCWSRHADHKPFSPVEINSD